MDIFLYTGLSWYFSQVWPSKVGVPKIWYFIFLPSYWFPKEYSNNNTRLSDVTQSMHNLIDSENGNKSVDNIPTEQVNESLLGRPTVVVNKLRKTFGNQVSVNDLSFKMYENQIFALLGHNGAGKVRKYNS